MTGAERRHLSLPDGTRLSWLVVGDGPHRDHYERLAAELAPRVKSMYATWRRIRLEAYGARLESGLGSRPHEFESRILRG